MVNLQDETTLRLHGFMLRDNLIQPELNRIRRGEVLWQVEPRIMDVLVVLALRAGTVVTRDELLDVIWGDANVGEQVLTRAVSELRRMLGDDTREPRYIATIRKGGYRLLEPLSPLVASTVGGMPAKPSVQRNRMLFWMLAVSVVIVSVVLMRCIDIGSERSGKPVVPRLLPLTSFSGRETDPDLSPDGTQVVFAWNGGQEGVSQIYVKDIATETPRRLSGSGGYNCQPVWSADGEAISFVRADSNGVGIYRIRLVGGPMERIYSSPAGWIYGFDYTADGTSLVAAVGAGDPAFYRLNIVNLGSGSSRELFRTAAERVHDVNPSISPDGRYVAFQRGRDLDRMSIWVATLDGSDARSVTSVSRVIRGLDWYPDGEHLILASTAINSWNAGLWRLSLKNGTITPVPCSCEWVENPSVSKTGAITFESLSSEMNIWSIPDGEEEMPGLPFISSTRWDGRPVVSNDGSRVAFISTRSGASELWICSGDGSQPVQVTHLNGPLVENACWSPDGSEIAVDVTLNENSQVYFVPAAGGIAELVTPGDMNCKVCGWSGDGKWLYVRSDESGEWGLWRIFLESKEAVLFSDAPVAGARIGSDGTMLYLTKPNRQGCWRTPIDRWQLEPLMIGLGPYRHEDWDVSRSGVYYLDRGDLSQIVFYDLAGDSIRVVWETENYLGPGLSVSDDGSLILVSRSDNLEGDLMLLEQIN
jgi:Tol biopolymer transport system component/DNA-binding winged helix-turn-helix (wHTH) protein